MTTENVAILFTDIVGSTALSQRLSAEVADEVRRGHFSILRQAITESGGTEVKNLGDGLMVVFSSASAALGCAVGMQQGVEQGNHEDAEPVGLRVGLSVGEVSNEEGDYFGDPVVEAARLCSRCDAGQILATDLVRAMAGRRSRHECRSLGELTLKGLPVPVESIEVVWEPLGGSDLTEMVPLPGRLAVHPSVGVVGRDTEVTAITDAVKEVGSRRGTPDPPRLGRGRFGQDDRGGRGGTVCLRRRGLRAVRPLRGGSGHPLPTVRRGTRSLRHPRPRGTARRPRRGPRVRTLAAGSGIEQPDPGPAAEQGHRFRHRAVPALCRRGGPVDHGLGAPARRPGPRRPPVGRQGKPAAAPPSGLRGPDHAGTDPRHLPGQRALHRRCSGGRAGRPTPPGRGSPGSTSSAWTTPGWWP